MNLTGRWQGNDGGLYYIREKNSIVWWFGRYMYPSDDWANVFRGTRSGNTIEGEYADVPKGYIKNNGTLTLNVQESKLSRTSATGGFGGSEWTFLGTGSGFLSQVEDYLHTKPQNMLKII